MTRSALTSHQRGMSLLELLVGIVISMLTVLVITQLFLDSERQRRVPSSGAHAQINGILALDAVQRDVRQAGYGLGGGPWLGTCTTGDLAEAKAAGLSNLLLQPVVITAGSGTAPSDSIAVLSSGKIDAATQIKLAEEHANGNGKFVVPSTMGVEVGDWLIVATKSGAACSAFQAQSLTAVAPWGITPSGSVPQYAEGSMLSNMGAAPVRRSWSVVGSGTNAFRLQVSNLAIAATPTASDAYPDVVLLRALYAKDTNADGAIDTYDATAPATRADWNQVIGVRLALVVRSTHWSKDEVTADGMEWSFGTASVAGGSACTANASHSCLKLGLTHTAASGSTEWKHYRYRMYESMIPLRNLLWNVG